MVGDAAWIPAWPARCYQRRSAQRSSPAVARAVQGARSGQGNPPSLGFDQRTVAVARLDAHHPGSGNALDAARRRAFDGEAAIAQGDRLAVAGMARQHHQRQGDERAVPVRHRQHRTGARTEGRHRRRATPRSARTATAGSARPPSRCAAAPTRPTRLRPSPAAPFSPQAVAKIAGDARQAVVVVVDMRAMALSGRSILGSDDLGQRDRRPRLRTINTLARRIDNPPFGLPPGRLRCSPPAFVCGPGAACRPVDAHPSSPGSALRGARTEGVAVDDFETQGAGARGASGVARPWRPLPPARGVLSPGRRAGETLTPSLRNSASRAGGPSRSASRSPGPSPDQRKAAATSMSPRSCMSTNARRVSRPALAVQIVQSARRLPDRAAENIRNPSTARALLPGAHHGWRIGDQPCGIMLDHSSCAARLSGSPKQHVGTAGRRVSGADHRGAEVFVPAPARPALHRLDDDAARLSDEPGRAGRAGAGIPTSRRSLRAAG